MEEVTKSPKPVCFIPFTQYILPNGRTREIEIFVDPDTSKKARKIINKGLNFELEVLRTGEISVTIADRVEEIDLDIVICEHRNELESSIVKLVNRNI